MSDSRLNEIDRLLGSLSAWPLIAQEIKHRIGELTDRLISQENEQTRGAIKQLRDLIDLPVTLKQERDDLAAGLPEQSDPAQ